jgi:hypothetical protein
MSDDVASDFGELGVVKNVGVAVGIASIALPVSEMQSTSGLESAMLIQGSRSCRAISIVTSAARAWWKIRELLLKCR